MTLLIREIGAGTYVIAIAVVKVARRLQPRKSGGTRMLVLDSRPLRRLSKALTSVCPILFTCGLHGALLCLFSDKKCPFTGNVSIRGRILTGKVVSTKMTRTIVIRRDYLHYIPKYSTLEDRLIVHSHLSLSDRPLREETQEHGRTCITRFPCRGW